MKIVFISILILLYMMLITFQPVLMGWDWREYFYPAVRFLLAGVSPYQALPFYTPGDPFPHRVYHPPWLLVSTVPFALLPVHTGEWLILLALYLATCVTVLKLHEDSLSTFFILTNPLVIQGCLAGNVDSFVALGLVAPPSLGLYLLSLKPQLGWGAIVYLIWTAYGARGVVKVWSITWPMALVLALSFLPPFGFWPANMLQATDQTTNASLPFAVGLALGLPLLTWGLRRKNLLIAFAGGFIASPYHAAHSWYLLLLVIKSARTQFILWLLMWLVAGWWLLYP
jgi:hypothetical protein